MIVVIKTLHDSKTRKKALKFHYRLNGRFRFIAVLFISIFKLQKGYCLLSVRYAYYVADCSRKVNRYNYMYLHG